MCVLVAECRNCSFFFRSMLLITHKCHHTVHHLYSTSHGHTGTPFQASVIFPNPLGLPLSPFRSQSYHHTQTSFSCRKLYTNVIVMVSILVFLSVSCLALHLQSSSLLSFPFHILQSSLPLVCSLPCLKHLLVVASS